MDALMAFCERHPIRRLWVYGSILRPDFNEESDVDVLVELEPDSKIGWEFFSWADELAAVFGRKVDLGTPNSLRPWLKDRIMASARLIYERT
jgi:hypothetical protein